MARTIKDIYDEMIAEKESNSMLTALQPNISSFQTLLSDLTTNSKVSVWRLIFFVTAVSIWSLEKLFDEHRKWIEKRAKEIHVGTTFWYAKKALEFQNGDGLIFNGTEFVYPQINESHRIIKLSSTTELTTSVVVKAAKLENDLPTPLDPSEKDAFDLYMNKIKFAGITVFTISRVADLMKVYYHIYVDPMVINTNGELILDPSVKPVEDAINSYIKNLPFDGVFSTTALTDEIQAINGVLNPMLDSCEVKYGAKPYTPAGDYYTPNAGYLKIDDNNPLSGSITYLK